MKQRLLAISLCLVLLLSLCGCKKEEQSAAKEDSGGTGYGAVQKSALTEQDLYFITYSTTRQRIHQQLGSPQEALMTEEGVERYQLAEGQILQITYDQRETVQEVLYTDPSGKQQSLFDRLVALGILQAVGDRLPTPETPEDSQEVPPAEEPTAPENPIVQPTVSESYFAEKTYDLGVAEQIIKEGVARETVISALGKPNRFSSVDFSYDGYIIDVYIMKDGTVLYLDYGYLRDTLRAMRKVEGSAVSDLIGTWGTEEKPQQFYRITKNKNVFTSVKKGSTPAAIFRRFGEPDWLEGEETHYKAVYKLINDNTLYFDFGAGNGGLSSAYIRGGNGSVSLFALR